MDAEELLVHYSGEGKAAEGLHAGIVYPFRVLVFAFEFECEVVRQVSALMVSPEQEECIWIPDFERPKVEYALGVC